MPSPSLSTSAPPRPCPESPLPRRCASLRCKLLAAISHERIAHLHVRALLLRFLVNSADAKSDARRHFWPGQRRRTSDLCRRENGTRWNSWCVALGVCGIYGGIAAEAPERAGGRSVRGEIAARSLHRSDAPGAVVAIQDMGAAGLTCSTMEMASRGGTGIEIDLAKVRSAKRA